jgi:pilus assembly protein CpaE
MEIEMKKHLDIVDLPTLRETSGDLPEQGTVETLRALERLIEQRGNEKILVLEDPPEVGDILERIAGIRRKDEKTAIFVISSDSRAEHIVEIMKAGATEFFLKPVSLEKFSEAVEKVYESRAEGGALPRGKLYSFIGSKGGLGTSVLAVNAAVALAQRGKNKTSLFDFGLQSGDAAVLLDILPKTTISEVSKNIHRLDPAFLRNSMSRHATGVEFLAAPANPEESEDIRSDHAKKILELAKTVYGKVVIDCPSMSLDACTIEVLRLSDKIFIVSDLSVTAIRNASRLFKTLQKAGIGNKRIEIVINRFVKGKINLTEIEKSIHKSIFWLFPNDFEEVVASINRGIPLVKDDPSTSFSKNMMEFCEKLTDPQAKRDYRGMKGLFRKFL